MKFEEFGLSENILRAIKELGYEDATPIQEKCIPYVMAGRDVVGQSSTGSGKTAVFGLPILEKIEPGRGIQMLILTPTRELCVQDKDALELYAKYLHIHITAVYGGVGYEPQIHGMRQADIVVSTPGRMLDHLRQGNLSLKNVRWLVLDEGDKMFEMGFIDDVEHIIAQTSRDRQTLLFSATFPSEIHRLVEKYLSNPVDVKAEIYVTKSHLRQVFYNVDQRDKFSLLVHLLKTKTRGLAMVFCATRDEVSLLTKNLEAQGIDVMAIHGGLAQNKRLQALEQLKNKNIDVLVATDVAARGLDIKDVTHIYNYDVPKTSIEYIHRIGRTARAGANGDAVTLLSQRDFENLDRVMEDRSLDIVKTELPEFQHIQFHLMRPGRESGSRFGRGPGRVGGRYDEGPRGPPRDRTSPREGGFGRSERPSSGYSRDREGQGRGFSRGPRPSSGYSRGAPASSNRFSDRGGGFSSRPRDFSRPSSDRDSGSGFVEISGGFGEKPKLVRISDHMSSAPHATHHHDDPRKEGHEDRRRKPFHPRRY